MTFDSGIGVATRWKKGQSGNVGGRPKSRLLSEALRARLAQVKDDDPARRSYAEVLADHLLDIALSRGPAAVSAASEIANRIEGRVAQAIQISDLAADLQTRSDEELLFHLQHGRFPSDEELLLLKQPVEPTKM